METSWWAVQKHCINNGAACACVSHLTSEADIQGESGSLIDWCWFHLGSKQRLTVDLSRWERRPLILVLFRRRVLIYVIFTKSAREAHLPFYVWLFIEVRGVPLYNPSVLPTRHLRGSGRMPDRMRSNTSNYRLLLGRNCQGDHFHHSAQENLNVRYAFVIVTKSLLFSRRGTKGICACDSTDLMLRQMKTTMV